MVCHRNSKKILSVSRRSFVLGFQEQISELRYSDSSQNTDNGHDHHQLN